MKKIIIHIFFLFLFHSVYAQDATLTKGETIAYLEKKFKEVDGTVVKDNITEYSYSNFSLRFENGKIITNLRYTTKWVGKATAPSFTNEEFKFNPIYITGFEIYSLNSPDFLVLRIKLSIPANYIQTNSNGRFPLNTNEVSFPFVGNRNDKSNGEKIKKAFLHLQALLKAEDDPFG